MTRILVRSARARRRSLRAAAVARPPCGCDARQSVRAFRRRNGVDLSPDTGDRAPDRHRPRRARCDARRPRAVVAAQRAGCDPHLVRPQLSRRRLCADQSRLSRRAAGACRRQFGREADRGARRSRRPPRRHRSRGADDGGGAERRGARDPGLAMHARDVLQPTDGELPPLAREIAPWDTQTHHLHLGHDRPVEGRAVRPTCSSTRWAPSPSTSLGAGRPLHGQPAAVPCRRHRRGLCACWRSAARSPSSRRSTPPRSGGSSPRPARTSCVLLGVMTTFLVKQPPGPQDRGHTLKSAIMVPLCEDAAAFSERFGCEVYTVFNMTEVSTPIRLGAQPARRSAPAAGRAPASRRGSSTRTIARWRPARSAS